MRKTKSIYIEESFPIAMADTAYFLENVDRMFIMTAKGEIEEYFEYFPKMMAIMDKLHKWGLNGNVAPATEKEDN